MMPPSAYELSWSTGELPSEIRPKNKRLGFLHEQLETIEDQCPEYETTKMLYDREVNRLKQYDEFNALPITDYDEKFNLI